MNCDQNLWLNIGFFMFIVLCCILWYDVLADECIGPNPNYKDSAGLWALRGFMLAVIAGAGYMSFHRFV